MREMTRHELTDIIKAQGCIPIVRTRNRQGKLYFYASRRFGKKMKEIYIGAESKINDMDQEQVLYKLARLVA